MGSRGLVPYQTQMSLGQGYNSFTQEVRLRDAVVITPLEEATISSSNGEADQEKSIKGRSSLEPPTEGLVLRPRSQSISSIVPLLAEHIDQEKAPLSPVLPADTTNSLPKLAPQRANDSQKVSIEYREVETDNDIDNAFGVSSYASVKAGNVGGGASAAFKENSKKSENNIRFLVRVTVTNISPVRKQKMEFKCHGQMDSRIKNSTTQGSDPAATPAATFTKAYGDCFISAFVVGGSLSALLNVEVHDSADANSVRLAANAAFPLGQTPLSAKAGGKLSSSSTDVFKKHSTNITVESAGVKNLPVPKSGWTIEDLISFANAFPRMVESSTNNIMAVLSSYSTLQSFQEWQAGCPMSSMVLDYSLCQHYMSSLYDDYMHFTSISEKINEIMRNSSTFVARTSPHTDARSSIAGKNSITTVQVRDVTDPRTSMESDEPIPPDPRVLAKYRRLCHQAMAMIQDEATALATNPSIAREDIEPGHKRMKTFDNLCPAALAARLPIRRRVDYFGGLYDQLMQPSILRDINCIVPEIIGDGPSPDRKYIRAYSENLSKLLFTVRVSIHAYHHPRWLFWSTFSRACDGAVGAMGFEFSQAEKADTSISPPKPAKGWKKMRNLLGMKIEDNTTDRCREHVGKARSSSSRPQIYEASRTRSSQINRVMVHHEPGSGYIQGLEFFSADESEGCVLAWKQWGEEAQPSNVLPKTLQAPDNGETWCFGGLLVEFERLGGVLGGTVLTRVAAVWRRS